MYMVYEIMPCRVSVIEECATCEECLLPMKYIYSHHAVMMTPDWCLEKPRDVVDVYLCVFCGKRDHIDGFMCS